MPSTSDGTSAAPPLGRQIEERAGPHPACDPEVGTALAYLARLPLSTVKIDRSFLAAIPEDRKAAQIVAAIIAMATQLGLGVAAEGIETEAQYRFLFEAGCPWGQGFGFARPQNVQAFPHCLLSPPPWGEDKP